jgi:hypothetical protein
MDRSRPIPSRLCQPVYGSVQPDLRFAPDWTEPYCGPGSFGLVERLVSWHVPLWQPLLNLPVLWRLWLRSLSIIEKKLPSHMVGHDLNLDLWLYWADMDKNSIQYCLAFRILSIQYLVQLQSQVWMDPIQSRFQCTPGFQMVAPDWNGSIWCCTRLIQWVVIGQYTLLVIRVDSPAVGRWLSHHHYLVFFTRAWL